MMLCGHYDYVVIVWMSYLMFSLFVETEFDVLCYCDNGLYDSWLSWKFVIVCFLWMTWLLLIFTQLSFLSLYEFELFFCVRVESCFVVCKIKWILMFLIGDKSCMWCYCLILNVDVVCNPNISWLFRFVPNRSRFCLLDWMCIDKW